MPKDLAKVRLPELPVFKKYSLALRQEFASADEVLSVLERTTTKIRDGIERADEERRRQDQAAVPEEVDPQDEGFEGGSDLAEDRIQEADLGEAERPFWEEPSEEDDSAPTASRGSLSRAKSGRAKAKAKSKTRRPKPSVVRVGHHGKPLASKKTARKKPATKKPATKRPATKKPATKKKAATRTFASSRAKPKSRARSRRR